MKIGRRVSVLAILFLVSPTALTAGTKEEIIRLQRDVLQLQKTIGILQRSLDENSAVLKSLLEQLNDQIAQSNLHMKELAEAIRSARKDTGQGLADLKTEVRNLGVKWEDTNTRIAALQQKMEESRLQVERIRRPPKPVVGEEIEPDQAYSAVYADYLMGNYDLAIAGFQDFLANFPDSEYSDNASFYLGVCYMEKGRFEQAIQAFDQVINLYPKADKTPPAYYKKATVLEHLQRNTEAIDTLRKLIVIFPDSQEATLARQELKKLGVE